jgi:hypothetical protein
MGQLQRDENSLFFKTERPCLDPMFASLNPSEDDGVLTVIKSVPRFSSEGK